MNPKKFTDIQLTQWRLLKGITDHFIWFMWSHLQRPFNRIKVTNTVVLFG